MVEQQNDTHSNANATQAPVIREGQPTRHETVSVAPEHTYSEQGQSIAQQLQQQPAPNQQPSNDKQAPQAQQQAPSQQPSHEQQQEQSQQTSHRQHQSHGQHSHPMPSENDLAKSQLKLLAAANRTLLDILQAQHSNGDEMCVNEDTLEIFMRNQIIYEDILDGFQH